MKLHKLMPTKTDLLTAVCHRPQSVCITLN